MTGSAAEAWQVICGDSTGRLYGVVSNGQGVSTILVADVAPDAPQDAQAASAPLSNLNVAQIVSTTPAINFTVTAVSVSANGHQLLLVGNAHAEDTDVPVLALVDLYGSQPVSATAAGSSSSSSLESQYPRAKLRQAGLFYVHKALYDERPGLQLLQASWHPGSSNHFAVLSSDNRWRLYHTGRLTEAEQTFWLKLPGSQAAMGLQRRRRGAALPPRVTAFCFGPQNLGWAVFTVLFLASDGGVYSLCPVVPFGLRARGAMLRQLPGVRERGTVHTWLLAAFLEVYSNESAAAVSAQPHVLETLAPCLQGPLNLHAASLKPSTARRVACTISHSGSEGEGLGSQAAAGFSAVLTGFSSGTVYAHALDLGQMLPCWQDAAPQVAYDHRGEVLAVRYEVEAVAPKQATTGLQTVPEESTSGSASTAAAAAAAAAADFVSPLLLLDALKINLHCEAPEHSSTLGLPYSSSRRSPVDSDEESDAGYDPYASEQQQQQRGGSSSRGQLFGQGLGAGLGDSDSDSDDEKDEQLQQLSKVTLHAAPELPGRFWACHDQGCWGINIRWLQQLNSSSGGGEFQGAFGSRGASSSGDWEPQQQQQRQEGQQQGALPAPALQELLVSGPGVASSAVVGNALFGSGCVVLERGLGPQLVFLKPRPTGVLAEGVVGPGGVTDDAATAAGAGVGGAGDELGLLSELLLTPEELDTRSRQQEYYADLLRGPPRLQPPAKPDNLSSLSPADPTGLQYSRDVTSWLSDTHVRFGVGVSTDLIKRVNELHDLVSDQEVLLAHLKNLASQAAEQQAALQARIDRLNKAAAALSERGNLLASMHWSLPRPSSKAEQQMGRHLEVWEKQLQQTQKAWKALRNRLDGVIAEAERQRRQQQQQQEAAAASPVGVKGLAAARAQSRQVTQRPTGPLTPAQLERVKELLLTQHNAIAADSSELEALGSQLEAWKLDHPEVDLPAKLSKLSTVV